MKTVSIQDVSFGPDDFGLIVGPCVIENYEHAMHMATAIKKIVERLNMQMIFKSSFDIFIDSLFRICCTPVGEVIFISVIYLPIMSTPAKNIP